MKPSKKKTKREKRGKPKKKATKKKLKDEKGGKKPVVKRGDDIIKISLHVVFDPHIKPLKKKGKKFVLLKKPKSKKIKVSLTRDELEALNLSAKHHKDSRLDEWVLERRLSAMKKIKKRFGNRKYERADVKSEDGKINIRFGSQT